MKTKILVLISLLILGVAAVAGATPFTSTVDFQESGTYKGETYSIVNDLGSPSFVGQYWHTVTFDPVAVSVDDAQLDLYYALATENLRGDREVWFVSSGEGVRIGTLTASTNDAEWQQKSFNLNNLLAGISGSTWSIAFKFNEIDSDDDQFYLDKSVLSGEYTEVAAVPEPGTMMLLGTGFLGLAVYGKRRRNR